MPLKEFTTRPTQVAICITSHSQHASYVEFRTCKKGTEPTTLSSLAAHTAQGNKSLASSPSTSSSFCIFYRIEIHYAWTCLPWCAKILFNPAAARPPLIFVEPAKSRWAPLHILHFPNSKSICGCQWWVVEQSDRWLCHHIKMDLLILLQRKCRRKGTSYRDKTS